MASADPTATSAALGCPNGSRLVQMGILVVVHCFVVTFQLPLLTFTGTQLKANLWKVSHLGCVTQGNAPDKASDECATMMRVPCYKFVSQRRPEGRSTSDVL